MHPHWKRLIRLGSVPGWIGVVVVCRIAGETANIDFTALWNSRLIPLWNNYLIVPWNFLQTQRGNVVLAIVGALWLLGLLFWPNRSRKTTVDAQPTAVEPQPDDSWLKYPVLPPAQRVVVEPVVVKPVRTNARTALPKKESWIAAEGHVVQLIPDQSGYTAILTSGQRIINARFDETWSWYLSHLEHGITLSVEGNVSSEPTDQQLHLLDCVCPDGIRVRPRAH